MTSPSSRPLQWGGRLRLARPDETHAPDQTTNYTTTESATGNGDNPAADGQGSRHNYTVIGQVGHNYDNNRNVLADGSREFRYNYKNQLRSVWRKSDGQGHGQVAKYREDAFGRQVYAESFWELSRRTYFDTRFELDVNTDQDGDGVKMTLVDGGMRAEVNPAAGQLDQYSAWPSRINRPVAGNETHYADFVIDVPKLTGGPYYQGRLVYANYEVRIFNDRYELWQTGGGAPLATWTATTKGRHNVGICAGVDAPGVWLDGVLIISAAIPAVDNPGLGFGSRAYQPIGIGDPLIPGITLLENLCYVKAFNRTAEDDFNHGGSVAPWEPRVTMTWFDGPREICRYEVRDLEGPVAIPQMQELGDPSTREFNDLSGTAAKIYVGGQAGLGIVIEASADRTVSTPGGQVSTDINAHPGPAMVAIVDATGAVTPFTRDNPATLNNLPQTYSVASSGDLAAAPIYDLCSVPISIANEGCASVASLPASQVDTSTGNTSELVGGVESDPVTDLAEGWSALEKLLHYIFQQYGTAVVHGNDTETVRRLQAWERILGGMRRYSAAYEALREFMRSRGIPVGSSSPPRSNPDHETIAKPTSALTEEVYARLAKERAEQDAKDAKRRAELDARKIGWFEDKAVRVTNFVQRKAVKTWDDFRTDSMQRVTNLQRGNYLKAAVGEDRYNRVATLAEEKDRYGNEIGLGGAVVAEVGRSLGVADIADGGEKLQQAIDEGDFDKGLDAIDQMSGGMRAYLSACAAVAAAAQAARAASSAVCFTSGTLVLVLREDVDPAEVEAAQEQGLDLTPYCEPKPIEDIRPGDIVLSRPDGQPGAPLCFSRVVKAFVNVVEELVDVTVADYATRTSGTIRTTVGHPFWVSQAGSGGAPLADPNSPHMARSMTYQRGSDGSLLTGSSGWVFATDLKAGYALSSTHGTPEVAAVDQYKAERTVVYNFQVEGTHSYFVATSDGCTTWVHNTNGLKVPGGQVTSVDPKTIRFCQDSCKATFYKGGTIKDLAAGLKNGSIKPSQVPPIRVVERGGHLITIDNRRLVAFREAGIPIRVQYATPQEIANAVAAGKFSAGELGSDTIRIRE